MKEKELDTTSLTTQIAILLQLIRQLEERPALKQLQELDIKKVLHQ